MTRISRWPWMYFVCFSDERKYFKFEMIEQHERGKSHSYFLFAKKRKSEYFVNFVEATSPPNVIVAKSNSYWIFDEQIYDFFFANEHRGRQLISLTAQYPHNQLFLSAKKFYLLGSAQPELITSDMLSMSIVKFIVHSLYRTNTAHTKNYNRIEKCTNNTKSWIVKSVDFSTKMCRTGFAFLFIDIDLFTTNCYTEKM